MIKTGKDGPRHGAFGLRRAIAAFERQTTNPGTPDLTRPGNWNKGYRDGKPSAKAVKRASPQSKVSG